MSDWIVMADTVSSWPEAAVGITALICLFGIMALFFWHD